MNQGPFTAVAADALILYSNYLIEQTLHMDVKCTAQAISLCGWRYSGVRKLWNRTELHMDVKFDAWQAKDNTLMKGR